MIKFGIVGMGIRGNLFANTLVQNSYAKLVAVSDVNENNLSKANSSFKANCYKNYEKMFLKEDLDAVIVATPDSLHKNIVIEASQRVKNIMIEKPLSTSVEECNEMCSAIKNNNVRCLVAFENRWSLPFISTKHIIDSSSCGEILHINCKLNNTLFVPTKMLAWSNNSTPAWFLFPHLVDMACWLSGKKVTKVYASGFKKKLIEMGIDTYDSISALVNFENSTTGIFSSTWILPESMPVVADQKYDVFCDKEAITIDLMPQMLSLCSDQYSLPRVLGTPVYGKLNAPPSLMLNDFVSNIYNDEGTLANEDDGRVNTIIIEAIHRSLELGQPVEINY
ncbi:MAG: Gfo/Idh/MocA family protein [Saccharofermentanales bacterium]|jgi:predicted dehydrogenase